MPLVDFVTDKRNRILIGAAAGVGLIIAGAAGLSYLTPAYQVKDSTGQTKWEVNLGGQSSQTGSLKTENAIISELLKNCDSIDGTSTGMLVCGTDATGGTGTFGSGNVITIGDGRFVNVSGDTMTGALQFLLTGGTESSVAIEWPHTASGYYVRILKNLSVSGSTFLEGSLTGSTIAGFGLTNCTGATTEKLLYNVATGKFSCGTDQNTGGLAFTNAEGIYVNQKGDTMTGTLIIDLTSGTYGLKVIQTATGANFHAEKALTASGYIVTEGSLSGSTIYSFGLGTCNGASAKLLYNPSSGKFECGTDLNTGSTYFAGQGLTLASNVFTLSASHSGSVIKASTTLTSSGSLTVEGAMSGATLYVATSLQGVGLTDCDAAGDTLNWDATSGRFSCGSDATGSSAPSINSGSVFTLGNLHFVNVGGDTMTGALTVDVLNGLSATRGITNRNAYSGSILHVEKTLTSSGSFVWENSASGSQLYVALSMQGAGLTDCDLATQTLNWDATLGRFSCGTDADTSQNLFETIAVSGQSDIVADSATDTLTVAAGANVTITTTAGTDTLTIAATDTNTTYTFGQGLTTNGTNVRLSDSFSGTTVKVYGSLSGAIVHAEKTLTSSGTLTFEGAASGSSLYLGSSFSGVGLTDCDAATDTLNWDATLGRFSCGTDATGAGGGSFGSGNVITIGDGRYVNISGDTMTGALTVDVLNGLSATRGITNRNGYSGSTLHVEKDLTSSGSFTLNGTASIQNTTGSTVMSFVPGSTGINTSLIFIDKDNQNMIDFYSTPPDASSVKNGIIFYEPITQNDGIQLTVFDVEGSQAVINMSAAQSVNAFIVENSAGLDIVTIESNGALVLNEGSQDVDTRFESNDNANMFFLDASTNRIGLGTNTPDTTLEVVGTASGKIIHAEDTLTSSGSIVWEGTGSGYALMISNSTQFQWIPNCAYLKTGTSGSVECGTILPLSAGGTNKALTASNGGIVYSDADSLEILAAGSSGQLLFAQGAGAPIFKSQETSERFVIYFDDSKIYRGSGASFYSAFSGSLIGAQMFTRLPGSGVTLNLYVNNQKVTTTALTTDNTETGSTTAATPMVLDTTKVGFNKYDKLRFDVSGTGARAGTGLQLILHYKIRSY